MSWKRMTVLLFALLILGLTSTLAFAQTSAGHLVYDQGVSSYLPVNSEQAWTFSGQAGDRVEASVVSDQFDPELLLIDPFGRVLEHGTDTIPNHNPYIEHQLTATGVYQLWVRGQAGFGYYQLSLNSIQNRTRAYLYQRYNFEGYTPPEWQPQLLGFTPSGRGYLGPMGPGAVQLTLNNLPQHDRVTIDFDVYVINSWDGNNNSPGLGPDLFRVTWSNTNQVLTETSFSNYTWSNQSYPLAYGAGDYPPQTGASEVGTLGYLPIGLGDQGSSVYHFTFHLTSSDPWLQFVFWGINLEPIHNESWGLDNVRIFLSYQEQYRPISFCSSSPATLLRPGMHLATTSNGLRLVTLPGTNETFAPMNLGNHLLILDGPTCFDGRNWWLVETEVNRGVGWIAETDLYGRALIDRRPGTGVDPVDWVRLNPNSALIEGIYHNGVNIRALPTVDSDLIGATERGEVLPVIGRTANGRWLQVMFTDADNLQQTGWVCRQLVRETNAVDGVPITEWQLDENCRRQQYP